MTPRTARRGPAVAIAGTVLATALLGGTACTSALEDDDDGGIDGGTLEAWPTPEVAGSATTPAADVAVEVHDLVRSEDGLTTLLLDVANEGNEDTTLGAVFDYTDVPLIRAYDPAANVEYGPVQIDDDIESGGCLCSSAAVTVPAGETTTMYVTYEEVPAEVEAVRLSVNMFTPVDDVPVRDAGPFAREAGVATPLEDEPEVTAAVESVAPTAAGTLVRVRYTNADRAEPVAVDDLPDPGALSLVDADGSALFRPRLASGDLDPVSGFVSDADLAQGDSVVAEVVVAALPDDTESVIVRGPSLRRSFPVPVGGEAATPTVDVPSGLEEPEIWALHTPTWRYDRAMVPTARPELPPVDEVGAELPAPPVRETLTSPAQPGWAIGVRALVRGPGPLSTLLLDVTNRGGEGTWPEGLGADDSADDLGGITVVDPAHERSYGVYVSDGTALSAGGGWAPDDGETVRAHAVLPALDESATSVTVDVPTFGPVEGVPVVDGPTEPADGPVPATMRVRRDDRLRMDVLEVGRMADGNGTLVRARLVNESSPEPVSLPFAGEGSPGPCDLQVLDPATGNRYDVLEPCSATPWGGTLAEGEQREVEVRVAPLPDDVDEVVLTAGGWLPSGPAAVGDDARPWYLTMPSAADEPEGRTYVAASGSADGLESTTEVEGEVEVVLAADVLFPFGSADLDAAAQQRLADLAGRIGEGAAGGTVTVTGHTDDVGDAAANQTLSEGRAAAVRAALEPAVGRSDLVFEAAGRGEAEPLAPNTIGGRDNPDGRQRNRRVTVTYEAR